MMRNFCVTCVTNHINWLVEGFESVTQTSLACVIFMLPTADFVLLDCSCVNEVFSMRFLGITARQMFHILQTGAAHKRNV